MKRFLIPSIAGSMMLFAGSGHAQGHEDLLRFSTQNHGFGTARSAAMGGAFASLGADMSSMSINPAGIAMYRRSELSFSPAVTSMSVRDKHRDADYGLFRTTSDNTRFAVANAGAAFHIPYIDSDRSFFTSATVGVAVNRMIDHNRTWVSHGRSNWSLLDVFAEQLSLSGIQEDQISTALDRGTHTDMLGAMMAYEAFLVDPVYDDNGNLVEYRADTRLGAGSVMNPLLQQITKGSVNEIDISFGANFSDKLYVGLTIGIQTLHYVQSWNYSEQIGNTLAENHAVAAFSYQTYLKQNGEGVNVKIGAIYRPIPALRIGVAVHTPTYFSVDERYDETMYGYFRNETPGYSDTPYFITKYNIETPTRLLGGVSYIFFGNTILSVDYERAWYNRMKLVWPNTGVEDFEVQQEVQATYKAANNVRVGLETTITPNVFLRLGYAYYDSMYKPRGNYKYGKSDLYSGGLGYRTGQWGIDFAYTRGISRSLPYQAFYVDDELRSGTSYAKNIRDNFILTGYVRF